jgi:4-hydroxybenzoyl-CoA thioesterase/acyl-CoA thioester hydrolase
MPEPFRTTRRVEFRDTDAAGIMHFSAFFARMEEAEHELLRELGLSVVMHDAEGEVTWPRVSAHCDFQRPARFENLLDIEVLVTRLGLSSATYEFVFAHQGLRLAVGQMTSVCCRIYADGSIKSIAIPSSILNKLQTFAAI